MLLAFDLDGTLVDSARDLAEGTNAVLESYGAPALPVETVVGMVGDGARVLVARALAARGLDPPLDEAFARFCRAYDERLTRHTRPYDGIVEGVAALARQARLAVVTNKPLAPARRLLAAFGLAPHFAWVVGGDGPLARKPDPAGLRHVMTLSGHPAPDTLLVGDSAIDLATARAAGVRFCLVRYGFGWRRGGIDLDGDDLVVDDPRSLAGVLGRLLEERSRV
jgi:phosphoglycolate phosphatase